MLNSVEIGNVQQEGMCICSIKIKFSLAYLKRYDLYGQTKQGSILYWGHIRTFTNLITFVCSHKEYIAQIIKYD